MITYLIQIDFGVFMQEIPKRNFSKQYQVHPLESMFHILELIIAISFHLEIKKLLLVHFIHTVMKDFFFIWSSRVNADITSGRRQISCLQFLRLAFFPKSNVPSTPSDTPKRRASFIEVPKAYMKTSILLRLYDNQNFRSKTSHFNFVSVIRNLLKRVHFSLFSFQFQDFSKDELNCAKT